MKITVKIELDECGKTFSVTSRPHESITKAFSEVGPIAEDHRRLLKRSRRQ